jgi:nucleoside-diphosphate-sugar epimerase
MSKETFSELVERCHFVINCAASIDFNARLDESIDSNIRGSLRMLELAKKIKHLEVFTHISTCYVNCDMQGLIKEEIYEKGTNCQIQVRTPRKL